MAWGNRFNQNQPQQAQAPELPQPAPVNAPSPADSGTSGNWWTRLMPQSMQPNAPKDGSGMSMPGSAVGGVFGGVARAALKNTLGSVGQYGDTPRMPQVISGNLPFQRMPGPYSPGYGQQIDNGPMLANDGASSGGGAGGWGDWAAGGAKVGQQIAQGPNVGGWSAAADAGLPEGSFGGAYQGGGMIDDDPANYQRPGGFASPEAIERSKRETAEWEAAGMPGGRGHFMDWLQQAHPERFEPQDNGMPPWMMPRLPNRPDVLYGDERDRRGPQGPYEPRMGRREELPPWMQGPPQPPRPEQMTPVPPGGPTTEWWNSLSPQEQAYRQSMATDQGGWGGGRRDGWPPYGRGPYGRGGGGPWQPQPPYQQGGWPPYGGGGGTLGDLIRQAAQAGRIPQGQPQGQPQGGGRLASRARNAMRHRARF